MNTCMRWGAKIAPSKSYNFASSKQARKWLKETWWTHVQGHIDVVEDFRYLGVHLSTQLTRKYNTLVDRWHKAMAQLGQIEVRGSGSEEQGQNHKDESVPRIILRN